MSHQNQGRRLKYIDNRSFSDNYTDELKSLINEQWNEVWEIVRNRRHNHLGHQNRR